jgi:hypothetical protein
MNLPKLLFVATTVVTVIGASFVAGVYSAVNENTAYHWVGRAYLQVKDSFAALWETSLVVPKHFLQPSRKPGSGVTINERNDGGLVMLSGFFKDTNEVRLIRRDGTIVRRWPVRFTELFPDAPSYMTTPKPPATDWNIDLHGALLMPDGSALFNFDYGGLTRLDRCGGIRWRLPHMTHHSVERAERGGFWVPGRREIRAPVFPPFEPPYQEDLILHVSEDGKILSRISVPGLFYRNPGMLAALTATGESFLRGMEWDHELVHVNKIEELPSDIAARFPAFEAGDLMLSLREQNLVFVVDPDTQVVKWWQVGPWIRQHDPEFASDGTIAVFNNNYDKYQLIHGKSDLSLRRTTTIVAVNPATRAARTLYGGRPDQEMASVIRGKIQETPNGGLLITEFDAGRVFESDGEGRIVWEYINRYDDENVAEITEAVLYPPEYFDVTDWACDGARS